MIKIFRYVFFAIAVSLVIIITIGGGFGSNKSEGFSNGTNLIFAHRGAADVVVENSVEAFDRALDVGFSAIETDVNVTKDGKLVIFHDHDCNRLLDRDQLLSDLTWEEIQDLHLQYKGNATSNKVLSLDQFLESQDSSTIIYLDIKKFSIQIADSLVYILNKYKSSKKIIVADSNLFYLSYLKYNNKEIIVALEGFNKGKEWLYYVTPKNFKADYYASHLNKVDANQMIFLSENELLDRKIVYGVNSTNISEIYKLGIHNFIYDYDSQAASVNEIQSMIGETIKNR